MLAGYAATTVTLGWLADLLVHQPDVLAALEESIDRGEDGYLDAVIAESLRLRPALPFTGPPQVHEGIDERNGRD